MTSRPRVKICGITRQSDAEYAVALGADAIGFVFWPSSPRFIDASEAFRIQAAVPAWVTRVGVFVDADPDVVARTVRTAHLDVVQLHGNESVDPYRNAGARLTRVAPLGSDADVAAIGAWPADVTPLVDAIDSERRGGTGRQADWRLAAELARRRPVLLAGGLRAANVAEALRIVRPWGIDVSSGVEDAPGIKSPERLRELFAAIAAAREAK